MKKSLILVGTQWGDEGKGKIVDYFSKKFDAVCRFQGGHNAGHTIYNEEEKFVLHLIPSGVFYDHVSCFIGQGVILSLDSLLEEIEQLESKFSKDLSESTFNELTELKKLQKTN